MYAWKVILRGLAPETFALRRQETKSILPIMYLLPKMPERGEIPNHEHN
jgi:hypothetical protein